MRSNVHSLRYITLISLLLFLCFGGTASAQFTEWGTSDSSVTYDCGDYQWPPVLSPCPEVQIKQKHDHTPPRQYQERGWDVAVTCKKPKYILTCTPYIPTQHFNGQYTVDPIPYDPPDPTFARGTKMPVATDDDFAEQPTHLPDSFNFSFFGYIKHAFVLGANGLITFDTTAAGRYCPRTLEASSTLPWPDSKPSVPSGMGCTKANMRDAIYGIYEDTEPKASCLYGDQGIYYGIQGTYPCRKIICSWNGIPTFPGSRNLNNRCTYQIVCYEGSNIIEVHVKRRGMNSEWQGGRGLLGIQNATGVGQVGGPGSPIVTVHNGAHAAYYPAGYNLLTAPLDSVAWRFTPQNNLTTQKREEWFRIDTASNGADSNVYLAQWSIDNPDAINDSNGYFKPLKHSSSCPNLSYAEVEPKKVSRYVYHLRFMDASGLWYDLSDTIVIGMDTDRGLILRPTDSTETSHMLDICSSQTPRLTLEFPKLQAIDTTLDTLKYSLTRVNGGDSIRLPDSLFTFGQQYTDVQTTLNRIPIILRFDSTALNVQPGHIDSINVHFEVPFVNGCSNTADLLIRIFPAYDIIQDTGICAGESYTWPVDGRTYYYATTTPQKLFQTVTGCDSVIHLHLSVTENSFFIDHQKSCKPIQWHGKWYYESNTATAATDIFDTVNQWNCDSTVQLDFVMTPLKPIIDASLEYFDFNHMDVYLTDVSIGGNGRTWFLPTGDPQTGVTAHYTAPFEIDSAVILMEETSPYGCIDTAYLTIPFRRDVIWVPNVFTPDLPDNGNGLFHSVSNRLVKEQMLIYNRFGELIFRCEEIDCAWDGTDRNGNPCPQGSYVYVIRYLTEYAPKETQVLKGTVTLLR